MKENREDLILLSSYIDGELSPEEIEKLEKKIKSSLELQKHLEEFKRLKELTSSVKQIPESHFFETRLMAELENRKSSSYKIKRWYPAIGLAAATIILMVVLKFNPEIINNLWEEQKTNIAGFYKENLQPLLFAADLNNEDIFNFAFNKELPLDNSRKQYLHLGYDETGKEYFEIKTAGYEEENNYKKFIQALKLDEKQQMKVDSIIDGYAKALESQVLVNDNNTVAINPNLWNYREAIFADLLVLAEDLNKEQYNKVVPAGFSSEDRVQIVNAVNLLKETPEHNYIFLTPDSIFSERFEFDYEEYEDHLKEVQIHLEETNEKLAKVEINIRFDSTLNSLENSLEREEMFHIIIDSNNCRVNLSHFEIPEFDIPDLDSINEIVRIATKNFENITIHIPEIEHLQQGFRIEYYKDDSLQTYEYKYENYNLDSLLNSQEILIDSINSYNWKQFEYFNDSMANKFRFEFDDAFPYYDEEMMKEQMKMLREELNHFREDMNELRHEFTEDRKEKNK
ncbi:MAG: hypothetical protein KJO12_05180 [Ignavibacteria bacterium]|nr:hypothetical protein [Ignavibacteria bacterium]